jgi:hypothetical protein
MSCEECRELQTHAFRSPDDLLHALQVAAAETDRGVLARVHVEELGTAEQEAMQSVFAARSMPDTVRYRFRCTVCGDLFELCADTRDGSGAWTRQEPTPVDAASRRRP